MTFLSIDTAIVVEFHPDRDADIAALLRLADHIESRIFAVVQQLSSEQRRILEMIFETRSNISILRVNAALGRGAAIRVGLNAVREPYVAILNLEDEVDPDDIAAFFRELRRNRNIDALVGDRTRNDRSCFRNARHRAYSRAFSRFASGLFRLGIRDVQAPLKVFRTGTLRNVLADLQLFDHGFDADLLYHGRKHALKIEERPISCRPAMPRRPLLPTAFRAILSLGILRLLHSRFAHHRAIQLLGRPVVLPFKRAYSILIFCWRDPRSPKAGGGEVYLHEQARCWVRQGHKVTWVAQAYAGAEPEETLDGIRIVRRGRSLAVFVCAAFWYVFRSDGRFDFIIDTMNGLPFFTPLFSRKPKVCLIYHVHSQHFREELPRPLADLAIAVETKLVPYVYRRTQFVTISESSASEILRLEMTSLPLHVIHSGVTNDLTPGTKSQRPTILFLGRLRRYKGVRKLIDAFETLKAAVPDARLVIAGTGDDEPELRAYARHLPDIEFVGRIDHATKIRLLQEAWVLGMPSSLEGWGIVVIEAACCGTPAVAFDVHGLRDCVVNGTTGFLAEGPAAFAGRLQAILLDSALRRRLSSSCLEWGANFSWDATASRMLERVRRGQPWSVVFEQHLDPASFYDFGLPERRAALEESRSLIA